MTKHQLLGLVLGAMALVGCEKNAAQDITGPRPGSSVKFFNYAVNAPSVNFYAGDTKVTAISATGCTPPPADPASPCYTSGQESALGTAYGAASSGAYYNALEPGQHNLNARITSTTDYGRQIATISTSVADGTFYSYYLSGIYDATAKKADAFMVEDPLPARFDFTKAYVRLVNASSNAQPTVLYARNTTTGAEVAIGGAVAYKAAGTFMAVDPGSYDLSARFSGSTTNVATAAGAGLSAGRVYTVALRGDATSSVTATKLMLTTVANR